MGAAIRLAVHDGPREQAPASALGARLDDLLRLLMGLPDEVYTAKCSAVSGSIGGHVRHLLDHVAALVSSSASGELSYDRRARGTAIESDPDAAAIEILRLQRALERWSASPLDQLLPVTALLSASGTSVTGWSTRARELAFVVSHTIHHQAIIALLLEMQGIVPEDPRFGYAPSTPS